MTVGDPERARLECCTDTDLGRWITRVVERMDGAVILGADRENLCRRATRAEIEASGRSWVIESQGLPNLLHELVHALFLGRLADDHGFDYGLIPLDLSRPEHRPHLWEELACCVVSAAYAEPHARWPRAFPLAWFVEQFEIQGVFHGLEHDLPGFRRRIDAQLAQPARLAEARATIDRGFDRVEGALRAAGAPEALARAPKRLDLAEIWGNYRATWQSRPA